MTTYEVSYLQAVEPDALPRDEGVEVFVHDELDGQGFPEVTVSADDRDRLLDYVRKNWGVEDPGWFQEYVLDRVTERPSAVRSALLAVANGLAQSMCDTRWIDGQENALEFVHGGERYRLTVEAKQ